MPRLAYAYRPDRLELARKLAWELKSGNAHLLAQRVARDALVSITTAQRDLEVLRAGDPEIHFTAGGGFHIPPRCGPGCRRFAPGPRLDAYQGETA